MSSQSETYQKLEIAVRREVYLGTEYARLQQAVQQTKNEILLRRTRVQEAVQQLENEILLRRAAAAVVAAFRNKTLLTSKVLSLEEFCLHLRKRIRKRVESVEQRKKKRMKLTATTLT